MRWYRSVRLTFTADHDLTHSSGVRRLSSLGCWIAICSGRDVGLTGLTDYQCHRAREFSSTEANELSVIAKSAEPIRSQAHIWMRCSHHPRHLHEGYSRGWGMPEPFVLPPDSCLSRRACHYTPSLPFTRFLVCGNCIGRTSRL